MAADQTAPGVPSTSDLAALDPTVAITLLIVVGLSIVAFYVGPIIRARFTQPPAAQSAPAPKAPEPAARHALAPVDAAADRTGQFIDHLLKQLERSAAGMAELDRRLTAKDREIDQLQEEITRLQTMLWQRERGQIR